MHLVFFSYMTPEKMASDIMLLQEAARRGQIDVLHNMLDENPSILVDHSLNSLSESLLHVATKFGHLSFVRELMKIDPDIAAETNKDGFRPLDIAVITGKNEIVKEILSFNQDLSRLKGKDRKTALHYAVQKGRVNAIDELLCHCPDSIRDVTVHGETALHLAVKSYRFDAFACIVKWLGRLNEESIFGVEDGDGNTVLHVAVSTKQHECIDLLLPENTTSISTTIQVNAKNADGLTPLDLLDIQDSCEDLKIQRKLLRALGAITPTLPAISKQKTDKRCSQKPADDPSENWFDYFKFQVKRDSPSDTRNALLVVAALIATVCFQSVVDPPNGILEKSTPPNPSPAASPTSAPPSFHPGGGAALVSIAAIFGSHTASFLFLFANSLGLTASTCIIIYLTSGFPFRRELLIALCSMMFAYGFASRLVVEEMETEEKVVANALVVVAFVLPFALRWLPWWGSKAWRNYWTKNKTLPY